MTRITKEHKKELVKLYLYGKSPADLSKKYPYKRTTIKELMHRKGVIRSQSDASKLAVKQGKKDKAVKALLQVSKTTNRFNPKKANFGRNNGRFLEVGTIVNSHNGKYKNVKTLKGWKYEHIVVAEKMLGRKLGLDEVVHHIDFDGRNNSEDNLVVMDRKEHMHLHNVDMNNLIHKLYNKGIIKFNSEVNKYVSVC